MSDKHRREAPDHVEYDAVLRENPGRLGGWLWGMEVTTYYPDHEGRWGKKYGSKQTLMYDLSITRRWSWRPTRKMAAKAASRLVMRNRRRQASQERSWKYKQSLSDNELKSNS